MTKWKQPSKPITPYVNFMTAIVVQRPDGSVEVLPEGTEVRMENADGRYRLEVRGEVPQQRP